jgi:archaemetzincin
MGAFRPAAFCLALALFVSGLGQGCSRREPKDVDRVESLADLELRRAFEPSEDFEPMPEPAPGDWLAEHAEKGQTFEQFVLSKPLRPDAQRGKLYLQPLGEFGKDAPPLDQIERFAEAFFGLEAQVLPAKSVEGIRGRVHPEMGRRQFLTGDIIDRLRRQVPSDAYATLGITMEDIYPGPDWNFVFGQATLRDRAGIYSFARYDPAFYDKPRPEGWRQLVLLRSCKVLAHETGHMFGIRHCTAWHCVMNGTNHLQETDAHPLRLCPVDLRKLQWSIGFDPLEHYRRLLAFTEEAGFTEEAAWLRKRIAHLRQ